MLLLLPIAISCLLLILVCLSYLQDVPVDDRPPRVVHHFGPVLFLKLFPVVPEQNLSDGIRASNPVVVEDSQLEVDLSQHA